MKIALDVDGVLADIHTAVFRKLGLSYTVNEIKRWEFFDDFDGLNKKLFWETYIRVWSREYETIPFVDSDCVEVLNKIAKHHRIDVVTCRPEETLRGTCIWLALKRIPYVDFVLLPPDGDKTKLKWYDVFIDDNPKMAEKDRKKLILFSRPWNRMVSGVRRVERFADLRHFIRF